MSGPPHVSAQTLKRVRDYVVAEPGFTLSFAAWDMSRTGPPIGASAVRFAVMALLKQGVVVEVERIGKMGRGGIVYAYNPPEATPQRARSNGTHFPELDDARIGELRPARAGAVVPHTRIKGASHSPGRDRKRQARGVRLTRGKGRG